jgi:hypothetical protein
MLFLHGFCINKIPVYEATKFGSGGMGLSMTEVEFASFIIFLKSRPTQSQIPIRKAATLIGRQRCGKVWVMGKALQVSNPWWQ